MTNVIVRIITTVATLTALSLSGRAQQTPPVLSTAPEPPPGVVAAPAQMSGLPLQVGDLPPGIVAVRVIRRTFSENVQGIAVALEDLASGEVLKATTNVEGRAQFTAMPVGSTVQARATVDGESLESQAFPLPGQGGVRLVLVAGVGAAPAPSFAPPTGWARLATVPIVAQDSGDSEGLVASLVPVVLGCAALVMGFTFLRRRRSREDSSAAARRGH